MGLCRWLKSRFAAAPINHVSDVTCDATTVRFCWAWGSNVLVRWDDVQRVLIRTTDRGPFEDDVFFVLEVADRNYVIPQPSAGALQLLQHLQQLPGFDNEAVIESMSCAENKEFLCWKRD